VPPYFSVSEKFNDFVHSQGTQHRNSHRFGHRGCRHVQQSKDNRPADRQVEERFQKSEQNRALAVAGCEYHALREHSRVSLALGTQLSALSKRASFLVD